MINDQVNDHWNLAPEQSLASLALVETATCRATALGDGTAADQVDDQDDESNHQQYVNQTAGDVEAETKQPQNQKNHKNCPKHVDLLEVLNSGFGTWSVAENETPPQKHIYPTLCRSLLSLSLCL
jgi:hypothetical protein